MEKIMSVIIPAYNIENYIKECLSSLINLINNSNFEVIVINDGSTDKTYKIIKNFQINYPKLKVYTKKNEGISIARNFGIKKASGKWLWFMDGDDYAVNTEKIINFNFNSVKQPIIRYNFYNKNNYTNVIYLPKKFNLEKETGFIYSIKDYKKISLTVSLVNKFYKKEIFKNNYCFNKELLDAEDMVFNSVLSAKNKVYFLNEFFYVYRKNRKDSLTFVSKNRDQLKKKMKAKIENMINFLKQTNNENFIVAGIISLIWKFSFLNKNEIRFCKKKLKEIKRNKLYEWYFSKSRGGYKTRISYYLIKFRIFWLLKLLISFMYK